MSEQDMNRPTVHLHLVPMNLAERATALKREAKDYGEAKARAGIWKTDEAEERARAEIDQLLGPTPEEAGHRFFIAADESGRRAGWVWTGPPPGGSGERYAWIYNIEIDEALRGRGLGRALLASTEEALRSQGCREVRFNVFSWNKVAVALYESAGYEVLSRYETGMEMRKRLLP